jgi:hypothetical protein
MRISDNNPYEAPNAPLDRHETPSRPHRGWRFYFWLMSALFVVAVGFELFQPSDDRFVTVVDYLAWGFSLVGLFGYAYRRIILRREIWRTWLPLVLIWDSGVLLRQFWREDLGDDVALFVAIVAFTTLAVIPQYVALYRYGYRSPELWGNRQ